MAHRFDCIKIQFLSLESGTLFLNGTLSQIENKNITMFFEFGKWLRYDGTDFSLRFYFWKELYKQASLSVPSVLGPIQCL